MRNFLQRLFGRLTERDSRRLNLLERIVEDLYDRLDFSEAWVYSLDEELDDVDLRLEFMTEDIDDIDFWATRAIGAAGGAGFESDLLWKALDDIDERLYEVEYKFDPTPFWSGDDPDSIRVIDPKTEDEFEMVLDAASTGGHHEEEKFDYPEDSLAGIDPVYGW